MPYQAKVDLPFDGYWICVFQTLSNVLRDGTYHFQPSPVVHGPNPDHDLLSPLYVIV